MIKNDVDILNVALKRVAEICNYQVVSFCFTVLAYLLCKFFLNKHNSIVAAYHIMEQSYNLRSPAVKRLMREAQELRDATSEYAARPLDDNLFEWHFTFRGPDGSEYEGGFYHGRITLPPEYPMKPPSIMLLNPNGRFELNKKICLSISGYHPESWRPSWSIRTAILAIIGFLPTKGEGAIGSLDYTTEERKLLARKSCSYSCPSCGLVKDLLIPKSTSKSEDHSMDDKEKLDRELAKLVMISKPKVSREVSSEKQTKEEAEIESNSISQSVAETLRHRTPVETVGTVSESQQEQRNVSPNILHQRHINHSQETTSLKLMIVLVTAIAILLLRRLSKMYVLI